MNKRILIADSGGTKTDWYLIEYDGETSQDRTESFHPSNWSDEFFVRGKDNLGKYGDLESTDLYFFGAGLLDAQKATLLSEYFKEQGFGAVEVFSDLHGAAMALLGGVDGHVVIMGTGSVLFEWKDKTVTNIIGGKGYQEGDEGSGFYFGKLLYEAIMGNNLSDEQARYVDAKIPQGIDELIKEKGMKQGLSALAEQLSERKDLFEEFHEKNIQDFYKTHLATTKIDYIHLVGGYVYHHYKFIEKVFGEKGIQIGNVIDKPIEPLVEYIVSVIE